METLKFQLESVLPPDRIAKFDTLLDDSLHARAILSAMNDPESIEQIKEAIGRLRALASEVRVA